MKKRKLALGYVLPMIVRFLFVLLIDKFQVYEGKVLIYGEDLLNSMIFFDILIYAYISFINYKLNKRNRMIENIINFTLVTLVGGILQHIVWMGVLSEDWEFFKETVFDPHTGLFYYLKIGTFTAVVAGILYSAVFAVMRLLVKKLGARKTIRLSASVIGIAIVLAVAGNIIYRNFFYYRLIDFETHPVYSGWQTRYGNAEEEFDVCKTSKEVLRGRNYVPDAVETINKAIGSKRIDTPMKAVKIAQRVSEIMNMECDEHEMPFMVQHSEDNGTWVVIGDLLKHRWYKDLICDITKTNIFYNMLGGSLCVVIDEETGEVLYMDHTQ